MGKATIDEGQGRTGPRPRKVRRRVLTAAGLGEPVVPTKQVKSIGSKPRARGNAKQRGQS